MNSGVGFDFRLTTLSESLFSCISCLRAATLSPRSSLCPSLPPSIPLSFSSLVFLPLSQFICHLIQATFSQASSSPDAVSALCSLSTPLPHLPAGASSHRSSVPIIYAPVAAAALVDNASSNIAVLKTKVSPHRC